MRFLNKAAIKIVKFYRRKISVGTKSRCIYTPTCSAYALEALSKFSFIYASYLIVRRLLRCNPLRSGGFDPVPDSKKVLKWLI